MLLHRFVPTTDKSSPPRGSIPAKEVRLAPPRFSRSAFLHGRAALLPYAVTCYFKRVCYVACFVGILIAVFLFGTGCSPSTPVARPSTVTNSAHSAASPQASFTAQNVAPSAPASSVAPDGLTLRIAYDAIVSDRPHLAQYALLGAQLAARLDEHTDHVAFYRVDWESQAFLDRPAIGSSDALLAIIAREMKPRPLRNGARPGLFWEQVAQRAQTDTGDTVVVYFGDASDENPNPAAWRTYATAGRTLANNPHVKKVIFCGAERGNRARIERHFPLGHDRLLILGPSEATLSTLVEQFSAVRR